MTNLETLISKYKSGDITKEEIAEMVKIICGKAMETLKEINN